ncbi:hypothetical protein PCE1_002968 [Barthelona sp. PCE]
MPRIQPYVEENTEKVIYDNSCVLCLKDKSYEYDNPLTNEKVAFLPFEQPTIKPKQRLSSRKCLFEPHIFYSNEDKFVDEGTSSHTFTTSFYDTLNQQTHELSYTIDYQDITFIYVYFLSIDGDALVCFNDESDETICVFRIMNVMTSNIYCSDLLIPSNEIDHWGTCRNGILFNDYTNEKVYLFQLTRDNHMNRNYGDLFRQLLVPADCYFPESLNFDGFFIIGEAGGSCCFIKYFFKDKVIDFLEEFPGLDTAIQYTDSSLSSVLIHKLDIPNRQLQMTVFTGNIFYNIFINGDAVHSTRGISWGKPLTCADADFSVSLNSNSLFEYNGLHKLNVRSRNNVFVSVPMKMSNVAFFIPKISYCTLYKDFIIISDVLYRVLVFNTVTGECHIVDLDCAPLDTACIQFFTGKPYLIVNAQFNEEIYDFDKCVVAPVTMDNGIAFGKITTHDTMVLDDINPGGFMLTSDSDVMKLNNIAVTIENEVGKDCSPVEAKFIKPNENNQQRIAGISLDRDVFIYTFDSDYNVCQLLPTGITSDSLIYNQWSNTLFCVSYDDDEIGQFVSVTSDDQIKTLVIESNELYEDFLEFIGPSLIVGDQGIYVFDIDRQSVTKVFQVPDGFQMHENRSNEENVAVYRKDESNMMTFIIVTFDDEYNAEIVERVIDVRDFEGYTCIDVECSLIKNIVTKSPTNTE